MFFKIDTISLQKKVTVGNDRLKRLDSSTSLFQRQTSFITKKVTNLANKLVNPFAIMRKKPEPTTTTTDASHIDLRTNMKRQISVVESNDNNVTIQPRRTVMISPLKRAREDDDDDEPQERRKVQMLSVNKEIRRPTGLFSYEEEEPKRNGKKRY